jgi:hypothetical protein
MKQSDIFPVRRSWFAMITGFILVLVGLFMAYGGVVLVQKETPRLCRGGSRSLTNPGVHP